MTFRFSTLSDLLAIQQATLAARERTGDPIGLSVEGGLYGVALFRPLPNGDYDKHVVAEGLSLNAAIDYLNTYGV